MLFKKYLILVISEVENPDITDLIKNTDFNTNSNSVTSNKAKQMVLRKELSDHISCYSKLINKLRRKVSVSVSTKVNSFLLGVYFFNNGYDQKLFDAII